MLCFYNILSPHSRGVLSMDLKFRVFANIAKPVHEVFEAVAKQANVSPRFFEWWYDRTTTVPAIMGPQQVAAVTKGWEIGKEFGMIPAVPDWAACRRPDFPMRTIPQSPVIWPRSFASRLPI